MSHNPQIYVGIPLTSIEHALDIFKRLGVPLKKNKEYIAWYDLTDDICFKINITINDKNYDMCFRIYSECNSSEYDERHSYVSKTGEIIINNVLFGAPLTSYHSPAVIDGNWQHGRSDPFVLNLELLTEIKNIIREKLLPEAEILIMGQRDD
jgi:hypothetical protein